MLCKWQAGMIIKETGRPIENMLFRCLKAISDLRSNMPAVPACFSWCQVRIEAFTNRAYQHPTPVVPILVVSAHAQKPCAGHADTPGNVMCLPSLPGIVAVYTGLGAGIRYQRAAYAMVTLCKIGSQYADRLHV